MKRDTFNEIHKAWMKLFEIRGTMKAYDADYQDLTTAIDSITPIFERYVDELCGPTGEERTA